MKEYKNNEELIDYLISKNIIINNRELALNLCGVHSPTLAS